MAKKKKSNKRPTGKGGRVGARKSAAKSKSRSAARKAPPKKASSKSRGSGKAAASKRSSKKPSKKPAVKKPVSKKSVAKKSAPKKPSGSGAARISGSGKPVTQMYGEGNWKADEEYREGIKEFSETHDSEAIARGAAADLDEEGEGIPDSTDGPEEAEDESEW